MEITVVTLVEKQMSPWKGNLPRLPIDVKYSATGTKSIGTPTGDSRIDGEGYERELGWMGTRGFEDFMAKLDDKVVMEVLVRCWSDGDVVVSHGRA
ncbi:hypothetical protein Tco_0728106 [Tanacetum coccineum]|uniref:Uncharacterized protein n=1 Tax=Tanacetum coccineum TaxID=301880 RepID=A0ABQ4YKS4_9ASTR